MNEIIYLEPDDDITAVIGRIKEISPNTVALVIPRGGNIAQSIVNLKLLKREIEKINKLVSLVTGDKISKNLASQVGITVYSTVQEAKVAQPVAAAAIGAGAYSGQIKIHRYNKEDEIPPVTAGEKPLQVAAEEESVASEPAPITRHPANIPPPPSRPLHQEKVISPAHKPLPNYAPQGARFRARNVSSIKKPIVIIVIAFIVLALASSVIFLPKADASIILKTEDISGDPTIIVDKNLKSSDTKAGAIPGVIVSIDDELTKESGATGSKDVGTKSVGEVTFYNYWDVNPQAIAAGTVISASGKNFVTNSAIAVPGASITVQQGVTKKDPGTAKVGITAAEPSDEYNLPASKFVVSSFSGTQKDEVYAQSDTALAGGTTKKVTIVSDADLAKAKDATNTELDKNITDKISALAAKDNKKIIPAQIKFTEKSSEASAKSGDEASKFSYKIAAKGEALAYDDGTMKEMISSKVSVDLSKDQMLVNPDKSEISIDFKDYSDDTGKMTLVAHFKGKKGKKYDAAQIQSQITNQKYGTALATIQGLAQVEKADLTVWPKFFPRTPIIKSRVKVKFDYIK